LILDLRENGGGQVAAMKQIIGGLFAEDTTVGVFKGREESEPIVARGSRANAFTGQLWVLVGAESASASELLARTVQLKGRGLVIGERSAGSVRVGRTHDTSVTHGDFVVASGVRITVADVVMPDGQPLEKIGVIPDVQVVPSPADLAAGRDPALAKALELAGVKMDAAAAGALLAPAIRAD
jgi:carboxyl-terminal processing protease